MIALFAKLPYRFLMNVGDYIGDYASPPPNVHLESWYPQPAVIPEVDLFIHHGGNNSFNEALYFGKPAIIMPYCWDGLDNAARIDDTRYGASLPRYKWTDRAAWPTTIKRAAGRQGDGQAPCGAVAPYEEGEGAGKSCRADPEGGGERRMSPSPAPRPISAMPPSAGGLADWGDQPDAISGQSRSSGLLLWKRDENDERTVESGLWVCTPGSWRLAMPGDELCYFLAGRATYTEHNGETIEVAAGSVVHFPSGWTGRCDVA